MAQMPFSPSPDDVTVGILGHIFGPIIDVLVKGQDPNTVAAASNLLAAVFSVFNSGVLVVGSIIVSYVASMGAINTANDGEAMGKAWSTVWTPVRIVTGGAVLLPSTSGYSFIQMLVLMISLWSIGFANTVYNVGMGMGLLKPDGIVATSYQTGTYFGLRDFGKQYLAAAYCARAANTIYADAAGNPAVMADSTAADKQFVTGTRTDYTFYIKDRNAATNLGGGEPICGTVTLTTYAPSGNYSDTSGTQAALDNVRAGLASQKAAAAMGLMQDIDNWVNTMPSDVSQPGWTNVQSSQFNTIVKNREDQIVAAIANQMTSGESAINNGVTAFIADMTKEGWAMAGGWYQRIGLLRTKVGTITSESVGGVTTPSLAGLPDDARSSLLKASVTTIAETIVKKAEQAGNGYAGSTTVKPEDMASLLPRDKNSDVNVGSLDADMSTKTTLLMNDMMKKTTDLAIGSGSGTDAITRMKLTGDLLASYQTMLWAAEFTIKTTMTAARVVVGAAGGVEILGNKADFRGVTDPIWDWLIEVPFKIFAKLEGYIGLLAFYFGVFLPSLPYTIFMVTVVGWVLGVLQTVIAAPLWAVMHMRPSQTFVGSEAQGYLLLMALFVRPALAVIGLFAATLVADPLVDYIAKAFFAMRGDVAASTGWVGVLAQFTQFFWWFIAFGGLLLPVLFMIYGLPQVLPDRVLAWLNVGVHDLGATSASSEMRSNLSSQARSPLVQGLPKDKDGGSGGGGHIGGPSSGGGTPRLGGGGGAGTAPVNVGGQGVAPPLDAASESTGASMASARSGVASAGAARGSNAESSRPLSAGDTPPIESEGGEPRRTMSNRVSDAIGVGMGHAVMAAASTVSESAGRAAQAMRQANGPADALVSGGVAAVTGAAAALKRTAPTIGKEAVAAFKEGADSRVAAAIEAKRTPSDAAEPDGPINTGDATTPKEET